MSDYLPGELIHRKPTRINLIPVLSASRVSSLVAKKTSPKTPLTVVVQGELICYIGLVIYPRSKHLDAAEALSTPAERLSERMVWEQVGGKEV